MNNDISCVFQGLGPIGAIYISNSKDANNFQLLQKLKIKAVITAAKGRKIEYPQQLISKYLYLQLQDIETFKIDTYFDQAYEFIEQSRKFTNILIHCHAGASRSVAIVIAYFIKKYNYSLPQIYMILKRKRSKIQPNPGFIKQLQVYSQKHSLNPQCFDKQSLSKPKRKVRRTLSLLPKSILQKRQSTLISHQTIKQLKQHFLKKKQIQQNLTQEEKQKISRLHNQRIQIEEKLKYLSHGLINGGLIDLGPIKRKNIIKRINSQISQKPNSLKRTNSEIMMQLTKSINLQNNNPNISSILIEDGNLNLQKSSASTKISANLSIYESVYSKSLRSSIKSSSEVSKQEKRVRFSMF